MGYYADLIKQKQEKRNSAESHLKGLIGKKFKRDTDLERAVNSSIYTEISDWSHPRMVVFDKYTDEKYILTTEDNNQYGKDQEFWISKVQKVNSKDNEKDNAKEDVEKIKSQIVSVKAYLKDRLEKQKSIAKEVEGTQRELERLEKLLGQNNSKEEKENYKRVKKEEYKGNIIEVFETAKDKYIYISYKKGSTTMNKYGYGDASSVSEALNRAKNAIFVNNSKEEKDNESKSQIEKRIKDAEERIKLFKRLEKEVQAKLEEGNEDDESRLRRQRESYRDGIAINQSLIEHLKKELKTAKNAKEEKDNDSQVIERGTIKGVEYFIEKVTETVKYPRPFEQVRYVGKLKKDGRVVNYTPRHERIDTCKRALEELAKEYKENSDEEKGYYAKLAEEKAERNNDKTFSLYGKNYSFGSDRQKNQQEFKKAQDDFNREYFKVKEEMDELQKELRSKRFKLDQQWSTFYSQVKGFLGL